LVNLLIRIVPLILPKSTPEISHKNNLKQSEVSPKLIKASFPNIRILVGSFGNLMGTPIIPQPQVAILAIGAIVKKPAVVETPEGDLIGIRQLMFMSHSYDHRVVDGSLGGMFLKHVHDYLQNWDLETEI
jgi:hypothetical protein